MKEVIAHRFWLPFVILFLVVLGCLKKPSSSPPPPPQSPNLQAEVKLSPQGVVVKNTDAFDFDLKAKLNLKETGRYDGEAFARVPVGQTVTIPYGEFTVGTERFSPAKTKIFTVYLRSGEASKLFLCLNQNCSPR